LVRPDRSLTYPLRVGKGTREATILATIHTYKVQNSGRGQNFIRGDFINVDFGQKPNMFMLFGNL
jgi:hypothetical protein